MVELWRPPTAPWTETRKALAHQASAVLRLIAETHPTAAIATSLQAEDAVLADLASRAGVEIDLVMLDTGRLAPETLAAKAAIEARYHRPIHVFGPEPAEIAAWVARNGADAFYENAALRHECCALRKVRPLARALQGRTAWITGQRRAQATSRTSLPEREFDTAHGIDKFNPLSAWEQDDVWAYIERFEVPVNALYARGYASIGCAPCTRAIRASEGVRAGRWWWEQSDAKECGLHVSNGALSQNVTEGQMA